LYKEVLKDKGISDDTRATAMYEIALCYRAMGLKYAAQRMARKVLDEFCRSEAAARSQESLDLWLCGK
jgi:TolA-binding protein